VDYLAILEEGQCIIRVNSIKRPFLLKVPFIGRSWLENSEIKRNNKKILENYKQIESGNIETPNLRFLRKIKKLSQRCAKILRKIKNKTKESMNKFKKNKKKKPKEDIYFMPDSNFDDVPQMSDDDDDFGEKENNDFARLKKFVNELATKQENVK